MSFSNDTHVNRSVVRAAGRVVQAGFSAIELMIAVAIGALISALVATVFITSATTYRVSGTVAEMQETGRAAVAAIERDARMAGFRGCNSNNVMNSAPLVNTIALPTSYANALNVFVRGYNSTGPGAWLPALDDVPTNIANGSDVLMLRVPTTDPIAVTAIMANGSSDVTLASTAGLNVNDRMIVADCAQSSAFSVTSVGANTVSHAPGTNSTSNLGRAYGDDAVAMRYVAREYYVGASSSGVAGQTSLWMRESPGGAQFELAENVERFDVLYGEDTNGDFVADVFRNANNVGNFANVVALQIHLITRGTRDNEAMTITPYQYMGLTIVPPNRILRRVYTSTIQLRNRVL